MAKYVIDIPDNTQWIQWMNVSEKDGSACFDYKAPKDLTPYVRSESYIDGLKKGQNEVWEFAKEVRLEVYVDEEGSLREYIGSFETYSEAKAKYDEWRKKKEEIRVGDEVVYHGNKYVVGYVGADEVYHIVDRNWMRLVIQGEYQIFKTGRHFDEVDRLLERMREG